MRLKTARCLPVLAPMINLLAAQNPLVQESKRLSEAKSPDLTALERMRILDVLYIETSANKNFLNDPQSQSSEVRREFSPTLEKIAGGDFLGKSNEAVDQFLAAVKRARDRATCIDIAVAMKEDAKIYSKGSYEQAFRENKDIIERVSQLKWKDDIDKNDAATLIKISLSLSTEGYGVLCSKRPTKKLFR